MDQRVQDLLAGNRRALARLLTLAENQDASAAPLLAELFPHTGKAWVIGVTGAPGTGKSSLVNALALAQRRLGKTVGIIAVDPTSPFSGGAILGDRIRMRDLYGDSGIFIRSMATRGSLGGLALTTRDLVRVMDAAGFDVILVETVGAGQSEVDIVKTAHTTIVVEAPGLGDDVQAIKAGILEIADILVVNKADRPGANLTVRALRAMLELGHPSSRTQFTNHHGELMAVDVPLEAHDATLWIPPVLETVATANQGLEALMEAVDKHRVYLASSGVAQTLQARYIEIEIYERLQAALLRRVTQSLSAEILRDIIAQIQARDLDPQTAVERLVLSI